MKNTVLIFFGISNYLMIFFSNNASAQPYIPQDLYNESPRANFVFLENSGQLLNTNGSLASNIIYYNDRTLPMTYIGNNDIYFAAPNLSNPNFSTNGIPDTLWRIRMRFIDIEGNYPSADPHGLDQDKYPRNYYLPHCGSGVTGVKGYNRIVYEDIYTDIDFHLYSNNSGLKTYIVIHENADPGNIRLHFTGHDSIEVFPSGDLEMYVGSATFEYNAMLAYEIDGGGNMTLLGWHPVFVDQGGGEYSLDLGSYDSNNKLILMSWYQPLPSSAASSINNLIWSTYIFEANQSDEQSRICTSPNGWVFTASKTATMNFPTTNSTTNSNGLITPVVCGFNTLYELEFASYMGTSEDNWGNETSVVANNTHVFLAGTLTGSGLVPATPAGAYLDNSNTSGRSKWFIAKFILGGAEPGKLIWSTYFGATTSSPPHNHQLRAGVKLDNNGKVFLVGQMSEGTSLKTLSGAFSSGSGGNYIARFSDAGVWEWGTYFKLPGHFRDFTFDSQNRLIIVGVAGGGTTTSNFESKDPGGNAYFKNTLPSNVDWNASVTVFNSNLSLYWSTLYGDNTAGTSTIGWAVATDDGDNIYLAGRTTSSGFLVKNQGGGGSPYYQNYYAGNGTNVYDGDGILVKFDDAGEDIHSTYFGGQAGDAINSIVVDDKNNIIIGGHTGSDDLPFPGSAMANAYIENDHSNGNDVNGDAFIAAFNKNIELIWTTYYTTTSTATPGPSKSGWGFISDMASSANELYIIGVMDTPFSHDPLVDFGGNSYFDDLNWGDNVAAFTNNFGFLGISQNGKTNDEFVIYPNPANDQLTLKFNMPLNETSYLYIYDVQGRLAFKQKVKNESSKIRLDVSGLRPGMYLLVSMQGNASFIKE